MKVANSSGGFGAAVPLAGRARLLADQDDLIVAPIVPAHPEPALIPHDHLLEAQCLVEPQRPPGELGVRAAATGAAAAAAAAVPEETWGLPEEPADQFVRLRAVVRDGTRRPRSMSGGPDKRGL